MVLTFVPFVDKDKLTALDPEVDLIRRLVDMVAKGDSHADQTAAVNLYVTLKSKPLIILTGDSQSDNSILVRALARVLLGDNHLQSQALMGHQWWVGAHGASGTLTTIHARLVTEKILATTLWMRPLNLKTPIRFTSSVSRRSARLSYQVVLSR